MMLQMHQTKEIKNVRAEKGLFIASRSLVRKIEPRRTAAQLYKVQSESDKETEYSVVKKSTGEITCDCADFTNRLIDCKHIWATRYYEFCQSHQKQAPQKSVKIYYDGE